MNPERVKEVQNQERNYFGLLTEFWIRKHSFFATSGVQFLLSNTTVAASLQLPITIHLKEGVLAPESRTLIVPFTTAQQMPAKYGNVQNASLEYGKEIHKEEN
ncbi:hypothetical protein FRX31_002732 [Thalictrum thalictroides]|uniref:Uncharacterized protein n=1 Tax=Thalictrum thalictroides TaxID=46969 RepID=A0A7J6XD05_THATH|nr:hypothetical protein FRX31_002732 [Thalictrum thalictroides]